ncbi:MAG: SCO family protein [Acetobacteraceae bacterium]
MMRRRLPRLLLFVTAAMLFAAPSAPARAKATFGAVVSVRGQLRPLAFTMTRTSDGKKVTAASYRGIVVLLYFGFTRCPDTCALTTYNAARLLSLLGTDAARVRFLFVTIDLAHDTVPIVRHYLAEFGPPPGIDGLHGTPAELSALARRYFVYYHAPTNPSSPDPVSAIVHASAVYLFGPDGTAEDIVSDLGNGNAGLHQLARRIESLLAGGVSRR